MDFIGIKPKERTITAIVAADAHKAWFQVRHGNVDFGGLGNNLHIMVYEFGLLRDTNEGYFSIGKQLYAGPAIIFRVDETGATVNIAVEDLSRIDAAIRFYKDVKAVEKAIEAGKVERPFSSVNGAVTWQWNRAKFHLPGYRRGEAHG